MPMRHIHNKCLSTVPSPFFFYVSNGDKTTEGEGQRGRDAKVSLFADILVSYF
jgi:hypothetical protein